MFRLIFRLIPWWGYAIVAWTLGSMMVPLYQDYTRDQADLRLATTMGAPPAISVSDFRGPGVAPLDEVHLSGVIRADLGINEIPDDTTSRTFVIVGPRGGGGPLIALITSTARSERMLNDLLSNAGSNGSVTFQGLLTNSGSGEVRSALARQDERGTVYLVEPFLNGREAGLRAKAQDSFVVLAIAGVFTAAAALATFFKLRAWLRRRSARRDPVRARPAAARPQKAAAPQTQPAAAASPWGATTPAANQPSRTVKPQTLPVQTAKRKPAPQPGHFGRNSVHADVQKRFPRGRVAVSVQNFGRNHPPVFWHFSDA